MQGEQVLMIGPYPQWDMTDIEGRYTVHKLWETPDRDALIAEHAASIRAIATRGERACPSSRLSRATGWGPTRSTSTMLARAASP
jgi:hypothetical protein